MGREGGEPTELHNDSSFSGLGLRVESPDGSSSEAVLGELGVVGKGGSVRGRRAEDGFEEGDRRGKEGRQLRVWDLF